MKAEKINHQKGTLLIVVLYGIWDTYWNWWWKNYSNFGRNFPWYWAFISL